MGEVYHYLLTSDRHDLTELRTIHRWLVKAQLRTVPGVAEVNSWGGYEKQYHVLFDPARLIKYDLTLDDVIEALRTNNANVGGGNFERAGEIELIQGVGIVTDTAEIANIVSSTTTGSPFACATSPTWKSATRFPRAPSPPTAAAKSCSAWASC